MVSMKKKIIVNSMVGLIVIGLIGWLIISFNSGTKNTTQRATKATKIDNWQRIKKDKKVTIGLDDTFVPMGFRDKNGQIIGFDVDLANAVFKSMGISVKWQPIDWSMKETELNTGNIDAIWNGYTKTTARAKQVAFSDTYHRATQVLVTLKKNHINHFSDMHGKILGDQTASSGDETFNQHPKVLKQYVQNQKVIGYDTFDKAFTDLNAGRIDGLLIDEDYARYYVAHQANPKNYTVTVGGFAVDQTAVGFRQSDVKLRQAVNDTLAKFKKDGRMTKIDNKWFSN